MNHADFYKQDQNKIKQTLDKLKQIENDLETAFQRWDELESLVD
jgi:ATP-binding cassette subfamily F protein uup